MLPESTPIQRVLVMAAGLGNKDGAPVSSKLQAASTLMHRVDNVTLMHIILAYVVRLLDNCPIFQVKILFSYVFALRHRDW